MVERKQPNIIIASITAVLLNFALDAIAIECEMLQVGLSVERVPRYFDPLVGQIQAILGSRQFALAKDKNGAFAFIAPNGQTVVFSAEEKWFKRRFNSRPIDFNFSGGSAGHNTAFFVVDNKEQIRRVLATPELELEIEFGSNIEPVDIASVSAKSTDLNSATAVPGAPFVRIDASSMQNYSRVEWGDFISQIVNVEFSSSKGIKTVPQKIMRAEDLELVLPRFEESRKKLLALNLKTEAGVWIIQGEQSTYLSETVNSGMFHHLEVKPMLDQLFVTLLNEVYPKETGDLKLTLVHTHPGRGTCLSPADLAVLNEIDELVSDIEISVVAIPEFGAAENVFIATGKPLSDKFKPDDSVDD